MTGSRCHHYSAQGFAVAPNIYSAEEIKSIRRRCRREVFRAEPDTQYGENLLGRPVVFQKDPEFLEMVLTNKVIGKFKEFIGTNELVWIPESGISVQSSPPWHTDTTTPAIDGYDFRSKGLNVCRLLIYINPISAKHGGGICFRIGSQLISEELHASDKVMVENRRRLLEDYKSKTYYVGRSQQSAKKSIIQGWLYSNLVIRLKCMNETRRSLHNGEKEEEARELVNSEICLLTQSCDGIFFDFKLHHKGSRPTSWWSIPRSFFKQKILVAVTLGANDATTREYIQYLRFRACIDPTYVSCYRDLSERSIRYLREKGITCDSVGWEG
jgi:hypothetical protein